MLFFIIWIICIPLIIWIILQIVSRRRASAELEPGVQLEECALCHEEFPIDTLLEKEVGGYSRVYCFCGSCIEQLRLEYQEKVGDTDAKAGQVNESTDT